MHQRKGQKSAGAVSLGQLRATLQLLRQTEAAGRHESNPNTVQLACVCSYTVQSYDTATLKEALQHKEAIQSMKCQ